jgi:hypothetical protein
MKWYWTKIVIGALVIFGLGFAGISVVRAGKSRVTRIAESTADIAIPLPFVSFRFDGAKSGNFRKLVIHRSDPHRVSGVDIVVRLTDPSVLHRLQGCSVTVDDPTRINENTSFRCASGEPDLEPFGKVIIEPSPGAEASEPTTVELVIPHKVIADLQRGHGKGRAAEVERFQTIRIKELSDSLEALSRAASTASTESEREAILEQIDDIKDELSDVQESIVDQAEIRAQVAAEVAKARAEAARARAEARAAAEAARSRSRNP